jgi:LPS-assembly protein
MAGTFPIGKYFSGYGSYIQDLAKDQPLLESIGIMYRDECSALALDFQRNFTQDKDVKPGTTILFRFGLKYLGDVGG